MRPERDRTSLRRGRVAAVVLALFALVPAVAALDMPGRLVDIGGYRLHLHCVGEGSPTVIMDTGLGGTSLEWVGVQRRLARQVTACTFDRAGYGWSDPGPGRRTSSRTADELYLLLRNAGVDGPYVLVAHSFGGYNMQLFATRYPYLAAGLVLVDASHPEQVERFRRPPILLNTAPRTEYGMLIHSRPPGVPQAMPESLRDTALALARSWKARRALRNEFLHFERSAAEVREAGTLPALPMVVLTRGLRAWPDDHRGNLIEALWLQLQDELAAQSPHTAHIIAEASGHHIHLDQPELVADAITMVVDFARSAAGTAAAPAAVVGPDGWLEFTDAWWRHDTLHSVLTLRAINPFRSGTMRRVRAGHFAGTGRPALQLLVYYQ